MSLTGCQFTYPKEGGWLWESGLLVIDVSFTMLWSLCFFQALKSLQLCQAYGTATLFYTSTDEWGCVSDGLQLVAADSLKGAQIGFLESKSWLLIMKSLNIIDIFIHGVFPHCTFWNVRIFCFWKCYTMSSVFELLRLFKIVMAILTWITTVSI